MADFGIKANSPATADARPHVFGFSTERTAPGDLLLEIRNGPDPADRVFAIDKDGAMESGPAGATTPILRQLDGREGFRLGPYVIEYNAAFDSLDVSYEPE